MTAVLLGSNVAFASGTATEAIIDTFVTVTGILKDPIYQRPGMSDARRSALETVLRNSVNYREMARRSLGLTWVSLTDAEKQHFDDLFVQVLRDAIAFRYAFSDIEFIYLGERQEKNFAEVRTLFRRQKGDTAVDLRLSNQSGRWLIYDVVIDGVRLVDNYRAQFAHVIKEATFVGLMNKMEAMTLLPKRFERIAMP
jgi:phospholipid transport system substrate-binding protein